MYYYVVPQIGTGTNDDPYRPDVDIGSNFVGQIGTDGNYIVATLTLQSAKTGRTQLFPVQALQNACDARGINCNDVMNTWSVS